MSPTPRTNNAALHGDGTTVPADFAADLECKLAASKAEIEMLREQMYFLEQSAWVIKARAALKETK
jgi:hypothetical protein